MIINNVNWVPEKRNTPETLQVSLATRTRRVKKK